MPDDKEKGPHAREKEKGGKEMTLCNVGQAEGTSSRYATAVDSGVPVLHYSWLSKGFFLWIWPLVWRGWRRGSMQKDDSPGLPPGYATSSKGTSGKPIYKELDEKWQIHAAAGGGLVSFVVKQSKLDMACTFIFSLLVSFLMSFLRPLLVKWFVEAFQEGDEMRARYLLIGIFCCTLCEGVAVPMVRHFFGDRFGIRFVSMCGHLLQAKALRLAPGALGDAQPDTLMGNDVSRTFDNFRFMAMLAVSFFSLWFGLAAVTILTGSAGVFGILFLVLGIAFSTSVGMYTKKAEQKALTHADKRLSVMKRILDGVKAIKYSVWEDDFLRVLRDARNSEIIHRRRHQRLTGITINLGRSAPTLATVITFTVKAGMGGDVHASEAFSTLAVFEGLRLCMINGPLAVTYWGALKVSTDRIVSFLRLPEFRPFSEPPVSSDYAVKVNGATFRWPKAAAPLGKKKQNSEDGEAEQVLKQGGDGAVVHKPKQATVSVAQLSGVHLELKRGSLTGVIGGVGSGKTSLISSLVGEMECAGGDDAVLVDKSIGYVPQRAFIVAGTLRHNVVMGRSWDQKAFDAAVSAAQMQSDIVGFALGADQEIGERGITLSGGQMQRVSVARALYGHPRLLIMDDPLSAVDAAVGGAMFNAIADICRKGYTADPTGTRPCILLAANQLQFAPQFDYCLMMHDCKIAEQGRHGDLIEKGGLYAQFYDDAVGRSNTSPEDLPTPPTGGQGVPQREATGAQAAAPAGPAAPGLVRKEVRATGGLSSAVLWRYISGGGIGPHVAVWVLLGLGYVLMGFSSLLLARWADDTDDWEKGIKEKDEDLAAWYPRVYAMAGFMHMVLLALGGIGMYPYFHSRSVRHIHNACAERVLKAPLAWFESTPSGRVIGRFSADMAMTDTALALGCEVSIALFFILCVIGGIISWVSPLTAPVILASYIAFYGVFRLFSSASREFKRMATLANAPVLTLMGETLANRGQTLIRCMNFGDLYKQKFAESLDWYNAHQFTSGALLGWQVAQSFFLGAIVSIVAASIFIEQREKLSAGQAGLGLALAISISINFQTLATFSSMLRISLGALERLLQLLGPDVEQEPDWRLPADAALPTGWPTQGRIEFDRAELTYRPGLEPALKGVDINFEPGSRVGIVGRTGAGKSSLFQLLFRLREATGGRVLVDGVDISTIGLRTLREHMVCLPQDALLIEGTLKENLDPFGVHSDSKLRVAIQRVGLEDKSKWKYLRVQPLRIRGSSVRSPESAAGRVEALRVFAAVAAPALDLRRVTQTGEDSKTADSCIWELAEPSTVSTYAVRTTSSDPSQDPSTWLFEAAQNPAGPWRVLHRAVNVELPKGRGEWGEDMECDRDLRRLADSLSAGERQLVALARALLRDAKVVVMDEPTSNVDTVTDSKVQSVIRSHLGGRTLVTIAHRLNTVIDAHQIVVLDSGKVAESGTPAALLSRPDGALAMLARQLGTAVESALRAKAEEVAKP
eukprot:Hpha_TRINITY_DN15806_c0_g2::TRINITY_DN15806_c0_g2_i1::g.188252::m.188252